MTPVEQWILRFRRPLLWVGYCAFAMAMALVTLYSTLPRDRIKDRLEAQLSSDPASGQPMAMGMDVTIGDLGLTLFSGPGIKAKDLVIRSRPLNPVDKPARYFLDDVTVHFGLFGLLFNRPSYSFKAHGLSGLVSGAFSTAPDETRLKIDLGGVVLTGVQAVQASVGLPLEGTVNGKLDVVALKSLAMNAEGKLDVRLEQVVVGDGKAKLSIPGDPFLSQGITFPRIQLGTLSGQVIMEKGRGRLESFALHSSDGEATLDGYIELHDPLSMSNLHLYLRFKPTEALIKREPTIEVLVNTLGSARRTDGALGFQITGSFGTPFFLPNREPPPGVTLKTTAPEPAPRPPTVSAAPVGAAVAAPPSPPPAAEPSPPPPPPPAPPPPAAEPSPPPPAAPAAAAAGAVTVPPPPHPSTLPPRPEPPPPPHPAEEAPAHPVEEQPAAKGE